MRSTLYVGLLLIFTHVQSNYLWAEDTKSAKAPTATEKSRTDKKELSGAGENLEEGTKDIGKGAVHGGKEMGKGAADFGKEVSKGDLGDAGKSLGKGSAELGKGVGKGSAKGVKKIGKGIGGLGKKAGEAVTGKDDGKESKAESSKNKQ
ncbi:MAG: hypothetical protein AB1898_05380 [Acidobacteriota bacterium]